MLHELSFRTILNHFLKYCVMLLAVVVGGSMHSYPLGGWARVVYI